MAVVLRVIGETCLDSASHAVNPVRPYRLNIPLQRQQRTSLLEQVINQVLNACQGFGNMYKTTQPKVTNIRQAWR